MKFYVDVSSRGGKVYVRYVENGVQYKEVLDFEPELYIKSNKRKDMLSMHDEPLERLSFTSIREMKEFVEQYKDVEGFSVYGSDNPVNQYITRNFKGNIPFDSKYIRTAMYDIEVFSGSFQNGQFVDGPFPNPETSDYPINAICVYNKSTQTYHVWGLEYIGDHFVGTFKHNKNHPRIGKLDIAYKGFRTERELLVSFLEFWVMSEFNSYSGWNIEGFDNPYLTLRIEKVLGESYKKKLSPWGIVITNLTKNDWGGESTRYDYMGCSMLDYMALFKKHAFINPENFKLNTVAETVLGEGKVEYNEANPNELYAKNYQLFIEYNIIDTVILNDMDLKMQLIDLTYTLAYMTKSNYQDTLGTVKPWSALAYSMLYERGVQPKIKSIYQGDTKFAGGFVRVVERPGKYRWVVSADLNSLYPHLMQMYNLGAETIIEPEDLPPEILAMSPFTLDDLVNKRVDLSVLKKYDICMTANRQFFRRNKMSIWNEKTREIYDTRKVVKKEMLRLKQEKVDLKALMEKEGHTPERDQRLEELERLIKAKDNLQHSCKILMNSLFGAIGNKYFREYFDIRVAEGITLSGQLAILWITRKIDEYFNRVMGSKDMVWHSIYNISKPDPETILTIKQGKNFAIYQDTDSVYIDMSLIVDKMFSKEIQENDPERIINFLDELFKKKIEPYIDESYQELADYMNAYEHRMFMKREVIAPTAIWCAKKRYTMMVADSEDVRYWPNMDHKTMGLDAKKTQFSKKCRNWLEETYVIGLTKDEPVLHEFVKEKKKEFYDLTVEQVAIPKGCNGLEKYDGGKEIFIKGTPKHVKAALWHNHLVKKLSLKVPLIKSGDKISFVELKKNPVGAECIAFQGKLPEEFGLHKYVDYDTNFNKNFIEPLHNFIDAINWNHEKTSSVMDWF